jgi:hypothetical protein
MDRQAMLWDPSVPADELASMAVERFQALLGGALGTPTERGPLDTLVSDVGCAESAAPDRGHGRSRRMETCIVAAERPAGTNGG